MKTNIIRDMFEDILYKRKYHEMLEKKINKDLFEKIVAFHFYSNKDKIVNTSKVLIDEYLLKGKLFSENNNLKYMGELLERFEERNLTKNNKDLFTMIFAIANLDGLSELDINGNQREVYYSTVRKMIDDNPDVFAICCFLEQLSKEEKGLIPEMDIDGSLLTRYVHLIGKLQDSLLQVDTLCESLIGLHYYINEINNLNQFMPNDEKLPKVSISIVENVLNKALTNKPMEIENNINVYTVLTELYQNLGSPKSREFKIKNMCSFLKAFENLQVKEITDKEVEKIQNFLKVDLAQIRFLNYYMANYTGFSYKKKITGPGYERLINLVTKEYLNKGDALLEIIKKEIKNNKNGTYAFDNCNLSNSLENFKFVVKIAREELAKTSGQYYLSNLTCCSYHKYILEDKSYTELLNKDEIKSIIIGILSTEVEKDVFIKYLKLAEEYNINIFGYYEILKNAINFKLYDLNNFKQINEMSFENVFKYIFDNLNEAEIAEYIIEFCKVIPMHEVNNKLVEQIDRLLLSRGKLDNQIIKRIYEIQNEAYFVLKPSSYDKLIFENLNDEVYLKTMEITEEDKEYLLKKMVHNELLENKTREQLRKSFLTEDEIEKEFINEKIESIAKCRDAYDLHRAIKDGFYSNRKIIESVAKRLMELKTSVHYLEYTIKIIKKLISVNGLSKDQLYEMFTTSN